jgi:hypothetical protein
VGSRYAAEAGRSWRANFGGKFNVVATVSLFPDSNLFLPIPVAVRSQAWFYGRLLAGVAGSNPAEDISCFCCVLCR